jgi:hypothetical protein
MTVPAPARIAVLIAILLAVTGCEAMRRGSEGAYRHAVADGTAAELARKGVRMHRSPECTTSAATPGPPGADGGSLLRVHCRGRTASGDRVEVRGHAADAETADPRESYSVTVNGREVLRKPCLGAGCHSAPK